MADDLMDKELMTTGVRLIEAERERQVAQEGYTAEHDDAHKSGELAFAAAAYAVQGTSDIMPGMLGKNFFVSQLWPFGEASWKPSGNRLRDLVKAGALIAAEIDRLMRQPIQEYRATQESDPSHR